MQGVSKICDLFCTLWGEFPLREKKLNQERIGWLPWHSARHSCKWFCFLCGLFVYWPVLLNLLSKLHWDHFRGQPSRTWNTVSRVAQRYSPTVQLLEHPKASDLMAINILSQVKGWIVWQSNWECILWREKKRGGGANSFLPSQQGGLAHQGVHQRVLSPEGEKAVWSRAVAERSQVGVWGAASFLFSSGEQIFTLVKHK